MGTARWLLAVSLVAVCAVYAFAEDVAKDANVVGNEEVEAPRTVKDEERDRRAVDREKWKARVSERRDKERLSPNDLTDRFREAKDRVDGFFSDDWRRPDRDARGRRHSSRGSRFWTDASETNLPHFLEGEAREQGFADADTDKDGKLSEEEFQRYAFLPRQAQFEEEKKLLDAGYPASLRWRAGTRKDEMPREDDEPSEESDFKDLERAMKAHDERMAEMSEKSKKMMEERIQKDSKRHVTKFERDAKHAKKSFAKYFKNMDVDKDDFVSKEEWMKFAESSVPDREGRKRGRQEKEEERKRGRQEKEEERAMRREERKAEKAKKREERNQRRERRSGELESELESGGRSVNEPAGSV